MDPIVFYFFLLSNCLAVHGYSLRSCVLSQNTAFCEGHNLTHIPTDIPHTVKRILLRVDSISEIQVSNFTNFPNLTILDLSYNSISFIGKQTFSQLVSLQELILNQNDLRKLEDDVFDGLPNLLKLSISFNHLQKVAPNAFKSLSSLLTLDLSNNELQTIAQVHLVIQHMPQLTELMIRDNNIATFRSQDLTNASTEMKVLDLSFNPLVKFEVTADVFPKLTNLNIGNPRVKANLTWAVQDGSLLHQVTTLDISAVQMASIDDWSKLFSTFNSSLTFLTLNFIHYRPSFFINMSCSIPKLSTLLFHNNKLTSTGPKLFQMCHNIENLDLKGNYIGLNENFSFAYLDSLRTLSLCNNRLQSVPSTIRYLTLLQTLDLSNNLIKIIQCQDFTTLHSLKELNLQKNWIKTLYKCYFQDLVLLEILNLENNKIVHLGTTFQLHLTNLKVLRINRNKLKVIPKHAFAGLCSLTDMSLDQNKIKIMQSGCFFGLKNLTFLELQSNELTQVSLRSHMFKDVENLKTLNLESNRISYGQQSHITAPFTDLVHLETFLFGMQKHAGWFYLPSNFLEGLRNLRTFRSTHLNLVDLPEDFFTHTPHLNLLDLNWNDFHKMSSKLFTPIPNLTELTIQVSNLASLDFLITANLTNLQVLSVGANEISVINEDIIRSVPSLQLFSLEENPFTCDCDNYWFVQWIKTNNQTQVPEAYNFLCNDSQRLLDLNMNYCLVDVGFICFISTTCIDVVILIASFSFRFSRFHLTYAYYILLAWLYDSRNRHKRAACRYDAFVSYNSHDEAWVFRELVPNLEEEQGWRLCLHHRDFLPGIPIVENIADAIYGSRKTICVISRRYLQSEWCSKEMQLASFRLFDEREDVLILLFLEDIPSSHLSPYYRMKRLLQRRSYLSWPRAAQHPKIFWEKLRQALRSTTTEEEDRLRLTVTD